MKYFCCPKCGENYAKEDRTYVVICPCGGYCDELPAPIDGVVNPHKAPAIHFIGPGWTEKGGKK